MRTYMDILVNLSSVTIDRYPQMLAVMSEDDLIVLNKWVQEGDIGSQTYKEIVGDMCSFELAKRRNNKIDNIIKWKRL